MKRLFAVIHHRGDQSALSPLIFQNSQRARGYADGWVDGMSAGRSDYWAEVVELRPVKKARGGV
jgi:hypothetical protein